MPPRPLSVNEILTLMMAAFGHFQTQWNLFYAGALGLLTVASAVKFSGRRARLGVKAALGVAFVAFAASNLEALLRIRDLRDDLYHYSETLSRAESATTPVGSPPLGDFAEWGRPPTSARLATTHVAADLLVLALILLAPNVPNRPEER